MTRALLAVLLLGACHAHGPVKNSKPPEAGVSIAVYERDGAGFSVIDDRRWIDLGTQTSILLANIDPGADLASLVLEPTNPSLHVGSCTRDRLPEWDAVENLEEYSKRQQELQQALERERRIRAIRGEAAPPPAPAPHVVTPDSARYVPVVRCEVSGAPGTYLVRLLYVSKTLRYRAQHDVELSADGTKAAVVSRFALPTPNWRTRAEVTLFDGVPGATHPPEEVTRGTIELDGTVAILAVPPKSVSSQIRRIFDGAILSGSDEKDPMWGRDANLSVVVWLELAALKLAPGPIHVHLEDADGPKDLDIPPTSRHQADEPGAPLRLPLWVDDDLHPTRVRTTEYDDGKQLTERLVFTIGNTSEQPRELFIEEHLRPAQQRKVEHPWPKGAKITSAKTATSAPNTPSTDILRMKVEAKPLKTIRTGYTLTYVF